MQFLNSRIVQKLKDGQKAKITRSITDNIDAHLRLTPTANGIVIRGYLATKIPNERLTTISPVTLTAKNYTTLPYDIRNACNILTGRYNQSQAKPERSPKGTMDFAMRVLNVPDILNPNNYTQYTKRGWAESTTKNAVTYYAYTIGKVYSQYGEDATTSDFDDFLQAEINRIYNARYQHTSIEGTTRHNSYTSIYNGIMSHWAQAQVVQKYLLTHHPEGNWPKLLIPVAPRFSTSKTEEIKSISYEQYTKLIVILLRLCSEGNPYAFAALGEACYGLRIGESCAPLLGDFQCLGEYGRYYVGHQVDNNGKRTDKLKTTAAYRYIFFDSGFSTIIDLRRRQLLAAGIGASELPNVPLASDLCDPYTFLRKSEVSTFLRKLLVLAGCNKEWIDKQANQMFVAAKATGNGDDLDVTAHLLRRTLATYWSNGGMPKADVDYLLGHTNVQVRSAEYSSPDIAPMIVQRIQRSMPFQSAETSISPTTREITISGAENIRLCGNRNYTLHIDSDLYIGINITALESCSEIRVQSPLKWRANDFQQLTTPDTLDSKRTRPVLSPLPTAEELQAWIGEATQLDLDAIRKHWH